MEWYAKLVREFDVAADPELAYEIFGGGRDYAVFYGIYNSKIGLWTANLSDLGGRNWPRQWPFKGGMATLPRDVHALSAARVDALAISAKAKSPEACWQWVAFLSKQMPGQYIPARRSLTESQAYEQLVGSEFAAVARATMKGEVIMSEPDAAFLAPAMEAFGKAMTEILAGREEVAAAMFRLQRDAELH